MVCLNILRNFEACPCSVWAVAAIFVCVPRCRTHVCAADLSQLHSITSYGAWKAVVTRCTGYACQYALQGWLYGSRYVSADGCFKIHGQQCDTVARKDRGSQAACPAAWSTKDTVLCRHECEPDPLRSLFTCAGWVMRCQFVLGSIDRQCDSYLAELKDMLLRVQGRQASTQTIERTLKRAGFTLKEVCIAGCLSYNSWLTSYRWQISKEALERNETKRLRYRLRMASQYSADQLVFVDESACDRRTFLRRKAWALKGHQAIRKQVFLRGKRYVQYLIDR